VDEDNRGPEPLDSERVMFAINFVWLYDIVVMLWKKERVTHG
jgi:hypothetical protein